MGSVDILSLEWEGVIEFNYSRLIQYEILKKPVTFILLFTKKLVSCLCRDFLSILQVWSCCCSIRWKTLIYHLEMRRQDYCNVSVLNLIVVIFVNWNVYTFLFQKSNRTVWKSHKISHIIQLRMFHSWFAH